MTSEHQFSKTLLTQISQNTQTYKQLYQYAHHSGKLQQIQPLSIFTKSSCDVQCNVVFTYFADNFIPEKKKQIRYFIIRTLADQFPKLKNKYSIAYIHSNISNFLFFRSTIKLLPEEYLKKLKTFYIVQASFLVKLVQKLSFGQLNNFYKSKTQHVPNIIEIQTRLKISLGVTKSKIKLLKQQQQKQNQQGTYSITKQMQPSDANIIHNKLYGKQLNIYQLSLTGIQKNPKIPKIIKTLIGHLYATPAFLKYEGIMRKSCDVEQLQILEYQIMENPQWEHYVENYDNPYVICGCIKKIFNNLNSPLFSYQIYNLIFAYRSDNHQDNDIKFLQDCLKKMHTLNRSLLCYTTAFLKNGIILHQQSNKMTAYNLAVVFGPCFFRPKQYRLEDLMQSGKFSFMIKLLLEHFDQIVDNAQEFYQLLEKQKNRRKEF